MRVRVDLALDVDIKAWCEAYGIEAVDDIRRDVRAWVFEQIAGSHQVTDEILIRHVELKEKSK